MMTMNMREEVEQEFWRENGNTHIWTWSLAVILLIFTCRFLTSRFRRRRRPSFPLNRHAASLRTSGIVSDLDLKYLLSSLEDNSSTDSSWEKVVQKSRNSISYTAKCCKPKDGPLKYLSITTFQDCSVDALFNFYLDNDYRMEWDKMVVDHQQLQVDHASATEIGRTIKKFPFLTPREYVLAWRLWMGKDGSFYCFSKECEHPSVPKNKRYVRVAVFRSGWRIRKVPGRNACEIRMVHQEDAGLNVEMAKMAFAKGIWSYVCKMDDALRKYSNRKRQQLSSAAGARLTIQKVPPEFEVTDAAISTVHEENSVVNANHHLGSCRSSVIKLRRVPSSKVIANSLVLIGGAICLSKGHSSLGTKVAMAYLLSKLTNRGTSPKKKGEVPASGNLDS
ncbi:hypothetical protein ACS0TY_035590 [Phlomoides rotata]